MILEVIVSILLILAVIFQSSKTPGMGSSVAGGAEQSFGGKETGLDGLLSKCTIVLGIIFAVLSLVLGVYLGQY